MIKNLAERLVEGEMLMGKAAKCVLTLQDEAPHIMPIAIALTHLEYGEVEDAMAILNTLLTEYEQPKEHAEGENLSLPM